MAASVHTSGLDEKFSDNTANLLKAAIPYAGKAQAKAFALAAKFLELKKILDCFNSEDDPLSICSVSDKKPSPEELLCDLRKYCDAAQAETIDKILGMLKMGKLYEKYQTLLKSPEFSKMLSSLGLENGQSMGGFNIPGSFGQKNHHSAGGFDTPNRHGGKSFDTDFSPQDIPSSPELENALKSMLSPDQLAMFEQLKSSLQSGE